MIIKIKDISNRNDAMVEAIMRWKTGIEANMGYEFTAKDTMEIESIVLRAMSDDEVDVYIMSDGSEVAVGNMYGPYATPI